jgi:hypothetical protein
MKQCLVLLLIAFPLHASSWSQEPPRDADDLQRIDVTGDFFNGKDLTGWQGLPGLWTVRDGAIVGKTPAEGLKFNTFLCSRRPYRDFELTFQVKLTGDLARANSGVQVRSGLFNLETCAVFGPQCDMGQIYWGSVYGEGYGGMMQQSPADKVKTLLKPGEFNAYAIRVVGNRIITQLNGETLVDKTFPLLPDAGLIAWQLHAGPQMEVVFKDLKMTELRKKARR